MDKESSITVAEFSEERVQLFLASSSSSIVGTLTIPKQHSYPPSVVVICHGLAGHRDYLYHKQLAQNLVKDSHGLYSFRFDFRDCGESAPIDSPEGRTLEEDHKDIRAVLNYLRVDRKLQVTALVGHSRGAVATLSYAMKYDDTIPHLINVSGRYTSEEIFERTDLLSSTWREDNGFWMNAARYKKNERKWFPAAETFSLSKPDMSELANLPKSTSFLTVYGLSDTIVSVEDSALYANLLAGRHTLQFVSGADHNFYGTDLNNERVNYNPLVVEFILDWLSPEAQRLRFVKRSAIIEGSSRFKCVEGVVNFRDLGGWPTEDGNIVRTGFVYRSASLSSVKPEGIPAFQKLSVKKSFDLRSSTECDRQGIYTIDGLTRLHCPLGTDLDLSPEQLVAKIKTLGMGTDGFALGYKEFLEEGIRSYRAVFRHILDHPEDPLIIHCTAGKDRTGIACALILLIANVDHDTVAREYELTTVGLEGG
ncbi:tyrosine phosphatase family-domain-containing protein [Lipomyces oligophaga]|uniref:tyrosine phosphatase family-domain-containing protein n=1 Tax=Lipomyces oligophaga TaxID=45792 RepID=UPI0034CFE29C